MKSSIYMVATPIGNIKDITYRAVEILKKVDLIFCEDTRLSKKLFTQYDISTNYDSYNSNSPEHKKDKIFSLIKEGKSIAFITDAGTPLISDPGSKIISEIYETFEKEDFEILTVPGASSLTAAVSICPFFGQEFSFFGFLPTKKGRNTIFNKIAENEEKSVFFESPHRVLKTLDSLKEILDKDRKIFIAREMTKIYEESILGTAEELIKFFEENKEKVKGEFVILVDKK